MQIATWIPYNNGHCDFHFDRPALWEARVEEDMTEEKSEVNGITGSNALPVTELGSLQRHVHVCFKEGMKLTPSRSRPFPYSKLPVEVRYNIVRILLEPVLGPEIADPSFLQSRWLCSGTCCCPLSQMQPFNSI